MKAQLQWNRRPALLASVGVLAALGGCQTMPTAQPTAPALQLIGSQPLAIANDCQASGSFMVEFKVRSDGRTGDIQAPEGPACVQQALTAWVSTFRYSPPGQETPAGVEWLMVTARKGT